MNLTRHILLLASLASAAALVTSGCANLPETSAVDCGDAESVGVQGKTYCVHRSAIIETGFNCPPEAQFAFPQNDSSGEPMTVCSPDEDTPEEVLEEVATAANNEASGEGTENPETPLTPACANEGGDEDEDGVCFDADCDDRDASIWENCPLEPVCTDEDNDGFCVEGGGPKEEADCDDTDAEIKPGIVDYCDGIDNNCDTVIDEEGCAETCDAGACDSQADCAAGQACREVPDGCSYCF